jgi:hypothetical protein
MRLDLILVAIGTYVAAALSWMLANECRAWIAYFPQWFVRRAAALLPEDQRKRYAEEWLSHINEIPGDVGKIATAVGFMFAAKRMAAKTAKKRYRIVKLHGDIPVRVSEDSVVNGVCRIKVRAGITTVAAVKVRLEPPSTQG